MTLGPLTLMVLKGQREGNVLLVVRITEQDVNLIMHKEKPMSFLYACIDMSLMLTPSQGQNSTKQEYQGNVDSQSCFGCRLQR